MLRVAPAQQRLEPADMVAREAVDRLEIEAELAVDERVAQVQLHLAALARCGVERVLEEAIDSAPVMLAAIKGEIGILEQRFGILAIARTDGDADARGRSDLVPLHHQWLAQAIEERLRQHARPIAAAIGRR